MWIGIASNERQAPTATTGDDGRKVCDGFYKTILAMIYIGVLGEVLGAVYWDQLEDRGLKRVYNLICPLTSCGGYFSSLPGGTFSRSSWI